MSTPTKTVTGTFVWHDHMSNDAASAQGFYGKLLGWQTEVFKPGEMDYPMISAAELPAPTRATSCPAQSFPSIGEAQ